MGGWLGRVQHLHPISKQPVEKMARAARSARELAVMCSVNKTEGAALAVLTRRPAMSEASAQRSCALCPPGSRCGKTPPAPPRLRLLAETEVDHCLTALRAGVSGMGLRQLHVASSASASLVRQLQLSGHFHRLVPASGIPLLASAR